MMTTDAARAILREPLTVERAIEVLAILRAVRGDDEAAHGLEDDFRDAVLRAIADGHADATKLARLALETANISFARWCA